MEREIVKIFNNISSNISFIFTTLTAMLGIEWTLFAGFLILNILDYITGIIKAKIKKMENSNRGLVGIVKKVCYWILIMIAFLVSYLLVQIGYKVDIEIEFVMFLGWFTLMCLIINEFRSILENLIEIGIDIPIFLKTGLEVYHEKIEKNISEMLKK